MACTTPFDVLRARTEDLSPFLHARAAYREIWMNIVPRASYPVGAGYVRSSFTVARSAPSSDEEAWTAIEPIVDEANGACNITYNQVYVGEQEITYSPEAFGMMGPLVCQDDFTMYWNSEEFWTMYFTRLEQRNKMSVINRIGNVYRQYCYKAAASASFSFVTGKWASSQPAPQFVDMSDYTTGALGLPTSELTQEMLDATAIELIQEEADQGDTDNWVSRGPDGPVWPLLIGQQMSQRIFLNNSELRSDLNQSFTGWGDLNPVLKRIGASRQLKNFRHVVTPFPARWIYVPYGTEINYTATGLTSSTGTTTTYDNTVGAEATNPANTPVPVLNTPILLRIPTFVNSTNSNDVTKGRAAVTNGVWNDPNVTVVGGSSDGVASFESVEVLNPLVMTEEVLMPVNSMPGMKLTPQNYFGEWRFVTGNDALLGIDNCTGIQDPLHKQGRHFAEYRHAFKPVIPIFGRMILWKRCANSYDTVSCS